MEGSSYGMKNEGSVGTGCSNWYLGWKVDRKEEVEKSIGSQREENLKPCM